MKLSYPLFILGCLLHSASCVPYSQYIGKAFSIAALALSVPHHPAFKSHFRSLDLLQLCFLFSLTKTVLPTFSYTLSWSWINFLPSFWGPLSMGVGNYLTEAGYLLSFAACLAAAIIISWFVTLIFICTKKTTWKFHDVFTLFKGPIRWVYLPLVYMSVKFIIVTCSVTDPNGFLLVMKQNLIAPAIVLGVCLIYPIWQLIARVVDDAKQQPFDENAKWVQFLSLIRLLFIGAFYSMSQELHWYVFIGIYVVEAFYAITVLVLNKWDNIPERIVFSLTEAVIIAIFSLVNFGLNATLLLMDIDFYLITIAFGIELIYQFYKYIRLCRMRSEERPMVSDDGPSLVPIQSKEELHQPHHAPQTEIELKSRPSKNQVSPQKGSKKSLDKVPLEDHSPVITNKSRVSDVGYPSPNRKR